MSKPDSDTRINLANCAVIGWLVFSKVQYRFNKKLLVTAKQKPNELERYLFNLNFSLHSQVIEKSITMPLIPTIPNFSRRVSKALVMQFV